MYQQPSGQAVPHAVAGKPETMDISGTGVGILQKQAFKWGL